MYRTLWRKQRQVIIIHIAAFIQEQNLLPAFTTHVRCLQAQGWLFVENVCLDRRWHSGLGSRFCWSQFLGILAFFPLNEVTLVTVALGARKKDEALICKLSVLLWDKRKQEH